MAYTFGARLDDDSYALTTVDEDQGTASTKGEINGVPFESGGGGSSDLSTAEVTITTGPTEIYAFIPYIFGDPLEPLEGDAAMATPLGPEMEEAPFLVPLYRGVCRLAVEGAANITVSTTGDIVADGADDYYDIYITGNGTITIS